jgi:type II secretory pathway component PulC
MQQKDPEYLVSMYADLIAFQRKAIAREQEILADYIERLAEASRAVRRSQ